MVSVLVPCYNEEKSLPLLYQELVILMDRHPEYLWEVLFINDGSRDCTMEIIRDLRRQDRRICYVNLSRNFGKENAMLAGFDYVRGDCMIIIDADLQDPPSLIPQMLTYWEQGYQDVFARRINRGHESWMRRKMSLCFYRILDAVSNLGAQQNVGDFRLLDRQCINALRRMREVERYTKGMFFWIGFKKKEILFDRADRVMGSSKWGFWKLLNLAIDGIVSFTVAPLRFAILLGSVIAMCAFAYGLFFVLKRLIWGDPVQGFTTLIATILLLGGMQLITIGILGEYIGRIFKETKQRPTYIASEYNEEKILWDRGIRSSEASQTILNEDERRTSL